MDTKSPRPYLEGALAIPAVQQIIHGDCVSVLPTLEADSFHAVVTDPPYHLTSIVKRFGTMKPDADGTLAERIRNRSDGYARLAGSGFMSKTWDGGDIAFRPETWATVYRVLKPGAYLCAFASTRGYHRMVCAIEDAGFIIHPMLAWIFGTGFPKAHRVEAEGWEGWRYGLQSLKPAIEPICLAQKPFSESTGTANVLRHSTGALNVDASRIPVSAGDRQSYGVNGDEGVPRRNVYGATNRVSYERSLQGRWPANVCHDGSPEIMEAFAKFGNRPGQIAAVDGTEPSSKTNNVYGQFGGRPATEPRGDTGTAARFFKACEHTQNELLFCRAKAIMQAWNSDLANTADDFSSLSKEHAVFVLSDVVTVAAQGGRALSDCQGLSTNVTPSELRRLSERLITEILSIDTKYLSVSEPQKFSVNESLVSDVATQKLIDTTTITINHWKSDGSADVATFVVTRQNSVAGVPISPSDLRFGYYPKAGKSERVGTHPTVKPVALMEWLVRLVTPPGGRVLDPFAGTGSTLVACERLGFSALGIEQDAQTVADAHEKLKRMSRSPLPPSVATPPSPAHEAEPSGVVEPETTVAAVRAPTAPQSAIPPLWLEGPEAIALVQAILSTPGTAAIDFETYPTSPKWHGDQAARDAPRGSQGLARERAVLEATMGGRALHRRPCTLQLAHEDGSEVFARLTDPMAELPAMFDLAPWEDRATLCAHNAAFECEILLKHGVAIDIECTLLAAKCLYIVAVADDQPQPVEFSLAALVEKEFGHVLDKGVRDRDWREPPDAAAVAYGLADVRWCLRLWKRYEGQLKDGSA